MMITLFSTAVLGRGARNWTLGLLASLFLLSGAYGLASAAPARAEAPIFSRQLSVDPAISDPKFLQVSCGSATSCMAIGGSFVERWNGSEWSLMATPPSLPGTEPGGFSAVDCFSATKCVVIGSDRPTEHSSVPVAKYWNGSEWSVQELPVPTENHFIDFRDIDCPSASECMAVGDDQTLSGHFVLLAERWNGTSWSVVSAEKVVSYENTFNGVSCGSTSGCMAVGYYWTPGGTSYALVEQWSGSGFTIASAPNPGGSKQDLWGVSCVTTSWCMAVGTYSLSGESTGHAIAAKWNGSAWTLLSVPEYPPVLAELTGVSCASTTSCAAIGFYPEIDYWEGSKWEQSGANAPQYALNDVSCAPSLCTVVGDYTFETGALRTFAAGLAPPRSEAPEATALNGHGATLHGALDPSGQETTYQFEYGTTLSYGSTAPAMPAAAGSGWSVEPVSQTVKGLAAGTLYHYRLVAKSVVGTTYGPDATFTTSPQGQTAEYELARESRPAAIAPGPDANLWVAEFNTSAIAKVTTLGAVTEYELPKGSKPQGIVAGPDGNMWFTEFGKGKIAKTTTSGTISEYALPKASKPQGIAAGPDGNLWFTEYGSDAIGKITTAGVVTEYALPVGSEPAAIAPGPDGNLWFVNFGTSTVGKITTAGVVTEYALPTGSKPQGIVAGPDGNLWFTIYGKNKIGKITTGGTITEYALPAGSKPLGIAVGAEGRLWFTNYGTNDLGAITTAGSAAEFELPSGSKPSAIAAGPDENMWFVNYGTSTVGSIVP
jgi:streptogramin lyase